MSCNGDPIECGWEAALGEAEEKIRQLTGTIDRVRAVYKARFEDAQTGRESCREFVLNLGSELHEALNSTKSTR